MSHRRNFLLQSASGLLATALTCQQRVHAKSPSTKDTLATSRKFTIDLCPGRLGVTADAWKTIELAAKHGFQSVQPMGEAIAKWSEGDRKRMQDLRQQGGLVWSAADLPVEFRKDEATFADAMTKLPTIVEALASVGVTRMGTYLLPFHETQTYNQNFQQHVVRLRSIAEVLHAHGLMLGLEYVGTKTLWTSKRFPFLHTMAETMELIAAIAQPNVGLVLDSWHWSMAGESVDDLTKLRNEQVVAVDLNDAPKGIPIDAQIDSQRMLPAATGVLDTKGFLQALVTIGYDGPVRAEPFNQELNAMEDDAAVAATAAALQAALQIAQL
jgi:sugar phosphate isomerase/epimerase